MSYTPANPMGYEDIHTYALREVKELAETARRDYNSMCYDCVLSKIQRMRKALDLVEEGLKGENEHSLH